LKSTVHDNATMKTNAQAILCF